MSGIRTGLFTTVDYKAFTDPSNIGGYLLGIGLVGVKDRCLGVYAVPEDLVSISSGEISNQSADDCKKFLTIPRPTTKIDGYTVKNKKLLTYPYVFGSVSGGEEEHTYLFEKSKDANGNLTFNIYCVIGEGAKVYILPTNYDHMDYNFNCAFETPYPQLPIAIAPFVELLGSNGIITNLTKLINSNAESGDAPYIPEKLFGKTETTKVNRSRNNPDYITSMKTVTERSLPTKEMTDWFDERYAPDNSSKIVPMVIGSVNHSFSYSGGKTDTNLAIKLGTGDDGYRVKGVHGFIHSVRAREAESIDNFFTMYGYTCDKVQVPNRHARPKFTYVKTQGCRIKPKNNGVPAKYMDMICSIYNSGITFWDSSATVGDYSVNNSPATP